MVVPTTSSPTETKPAVPVTETKKASVVLSSPAEPASVPSTSPPKSSLSSDKLAVPPKGSSSERSESIRRKAPSPISPPATSEHVSEVVPGELDSRNASLKEDDWSTRAIRSPVIAEPPTPLTSDESEDRRSVPTASIASGSPTTSSLVGVRGSSEVLGASDASAHAHPVAAPVILRSASLEATNAKPLSLSASVPGTPNDGTDSPATDEEGFTEVRRKKKRKKSFKKKYQ